MFGWSEQITSCPSKLFCHENGIFSHPQCCILNCQQALIQSLVKFCHLELNSASDGCFPLQCCGLTITGSLISLPAISDSRMSKRFVGCAPRLHHGLFTLTLCYLDISISPQRYFND